VTESSHAVFLSYASQDAPAARRICDALRSAGIEVWFDQSELRGGDAWDQRIRQEVRECALFVPVISATTTARPEGYFRLEWSLAEQRSRMIARNKPFIVPVCLDHTAESSADVPESFQRAQWTRLPGGNTPAAFVEQVRRLLVPLPAPGRARTAPAAPVIAPVDPGHAAVNRRPRSLWFFIGALLAAVIAYRLVHKFIDRHPTPAPASAPAHATGANVAPVSARPTSFAMEFDRGAHWSPGGERRQHSSPDKLRWSVSDLRSAVMSEPRKLV
jgi:hypothetical protein